VYQEVIVRPPRGEELIHQLHFFVRQGLLVWSVRRDSFSVRQFGCPVCRFSCSVGCFSCLQLSFVGSTLLCDLV
jgi:hypothetical protein